MLAVGSRGRTPRTVSMLKQNWCKCVLLVCIVITIVAAVSIACLKHSKATACPSDLIGVGEKCFYFSNDTGDWEASKRFCKSQGSELARVDTQTDMEFLKKHTGTAMHWIGLSRRLGESWKWTDGSTFTDWFEIRGNGSFAFLNADGVHSSRGFVDINWICSKPRYL